mgnify:FL=1
MTVRLVIADDHLLFRRGLRQLCEVNGDFVVLAEAGTGLEAVEAVRRYRPDVTLMDIRMPDMSGTEALRRIVVEMPAARVLMLTMYQQDHTVTEAIQAGAAGYVLKTADEETLFSAIRAVHEGQGWIDRRVTVHVLHALRGKSDPLAGLDAQDIAILRLIARGKDNDSIAAELGFARGTVTNRLRAIFRTIDVSNRTEAALFALRQGLATLDDE